MSRFLLILLGRNKFQITDLVMGEKKILGRVTSPPSTVIDIAIVINRLAAPKMILAAKSPPVPGDISTSANKKSFVPQGVSWNVELTPAIQNQEAYVAQIRLRMKVKALLAPTSQNSFRMLIARSRRWIGNAVDHPLNIMKNMI
jgi:hypothetical protein